MRRIRKIAILALWVFAADVEIYAQVLPGDPGGGRDAVRPGALADPAIRSRLVEELRLRQADERARGVELVRALGLPVREVSTNGKVTEVAGVGVDGKPLYLETHNVNAAISTGANILNAVPNNLNGSGVIIGMWDGGGGRTTHQEFSGGRMTILDGASAVDHATHVGGTMIAAGVQANAKGMAPVASVDSYDWNSDFTEMAQRGAATSNEAGALYLSNHSYGYRSGWDYVAAGSPFRVWEWWGDGTSASAIEADFGRYNTLSRDTDNVAFGAPYYLMFWSAGNERNNNPSTGETVALSAGSSTVVNYDSALHPAGDGVYRGGFENVGYNGVAKNVMTVGSVLDAVTSGSRDASKASPSTFTSWGPTDDGRIKPDVVANGDGLYSALSGGDTSYGIFSGTSMAAPNATGTAALLIEEYRRLFGYNMRASTLKALMIHTATDRGHDGPDYKYGWGLVDGTSAVQVIRSQFADPGRQRMREVTLTSANRPYELAFTWDGVSPIRATLCWTDPPGTATATPDSRTPRLVNNLDLTLIGPGGETYFPFVMPFVGTWTTASMDLPATNGVNNVDNVEQIYLSAPAESGTYRVRVNYQGTLANNQQTFSLLLDGAKPVTLVDTSLTITNPASGLTVVYAVSNLTFSGQAGGSLAGELSWTNLLTGASGNLAATTNWSVVGHALGVGSNVWVISGTNHPVAGDILAADNAGNAAYDDDWSDGDSGGYGFVGWSFGHVGPDAGHFLSSGATNQSLAGRVWGLYANNGSEANAYRVFSQPMRPGDQLQLELENNWVGPTGVVGVALLNGSSETLAEFYFAGGGANYQINDAAGARDSGLAFTENGLSMAWAMTSEDSFQLVTGNITNEGQFVARDDQAPARFRAFNYSAGNGGGHDFFFNQLSITAGVPPVVTASATVTVVRAGQVPVIQPIAQQTATVAQVFNYTVTASDAENDDISYTVSSSTPSNTWTITLVTNAARITYQPVLAHTGLATFAFTAHDKDGSSEPANLVVRVLPPPGLPVFDPVDPPIATMLATTSFVITAGGNPEPVVSLAGTTATGAADYDVPSGLLTYTPSYADGGEQWFTFHASNSIGVVTQQIPVQVSYITPPAPTSIWVSVTNDTALEATWTAVDAATGYELDVHTDLSFGETPYYQSAVEDFSTIATGSADYVTRVWTNNGIGWTAYRARTDQTINGPALALENAADAYVVSDPLPRGIDEISLVYRRLASGGAANFSVIVNGTNLQTTALINNTTGSLTLTNLNISGPASLMITNHGDAVAIIDDVFITSPPFYLGEFIDGYAGRPVSGTSVWVNGLQPDTTYYLRVRATNSAGVSANSPATNVTTRLSQTITFAPIADQIITNSLTLAATTSSGLPVSYAFEGPVSVVATSNLTFTATGAVKIVASQTGDATFAPAPDITNTFNVLPVPPPELSVDPAVDQSFALPPGASTNFSLNVINSGGGPLTWSISANTYDFRDDMEQGTNGWYVYGINATWHQSTNRAYSGSHAWYCGTPGGSTHVADMESYAALPWVHLHTNAPSLRFRHWGDIEQDSATVAWDAGLVGLIDEAGAFNLLSGTNAYTHQWYYNTNILVFSGSFDWRESTIDLSDFAGQRVRLVFLYLSDVYIEQEGWYIDDVAISPREEGDDWLVIEPLAGEVLASSTSQVAVTISAADLGAGAQRNADITVSGNDPENPAVTFRVDLSVDKEPATITLGNLVQVYNGLPKTVTYATSPTGFTAFITYDGSYAPPSALGNYTVVGEIDSPVYGGSVTGTLSIINLEGAIAVEDSIGDPDDARMPFGEQDIGMVKIESITIRNTNDTLDLSITDIRLTGAAAPQASSVKTSSMLDKPVKSSPSPRDLRAAALTSTAERAPDSIIVKFKPDAPDAPARAALHADMGTLPLRSFQVLPADVVELPQGHAIADTIAAYEAHEAVEYAEPNFIYKLNSAPNDPSFGQLWGLNNTGQSGGTPGADISALEAWAYTTGSTNVIVAVIDTGIDYNHPDLAANMWINPNPTFGDIHGARFISGNGEPTSGDPMDDEGHGTHVAGTIGAVGNNGIGVAGVNWNVRLMALKFITSANQGSLADAIGCIEYAIEHGAHLSNNSWGGGGYSQALKDAIDAASRANQLFVAAAGNDGTNNDTLPHYPSNYDSPNVIAVASSTSGDDRSSFSNYGTNSVHLAAPGSAILSTVWNDSYATYNGTSMASPHVAGVAALLLARHPNASFADVKRWILDSVDPLPALSTLVQTGGRLNAAAAIELAQFGVSITNRFPIVIPPGDSVTIPVRYLPTRQEDAGDTIVVSNNDELNSAIEVALSGRGMLTQSIDFPAIADQLATNVVDLAATSTSGSNVSFMVATGPAELTGDQLSFTNDGEVIVVATQDGSTFWRAAAPVTNSFMVNKVDQSISFALYPVWQHITNEVALSATASSGLPVSFSVASGVASVNTDALTFSAAGDVVIAANQPGNGQWSAAPEVTATVRAYEDANENTLPDDWEAEHFEPAYEITATSDLDGDGLPDTQEFTAGTNPSDPSDRLALNTQESAPGASDDIFVLRWTSESNRFYSVVFKTNLLESFTPVTSGLHATPPVNIFTSEQQNSMSPAYYRIGVSLEP